MVENCPVCWGTKFVNNKVLWTDLIDDWQLAPFEVEYINKQQGYACLSCQNNLRSMTLASALLKVCEFKGSLIDFSESNIEQNLSFLEINEAGNLSLFLTKLSKHQLINYPEYDLQQLDIKNDIYDVVLHSDTLEHVKNPIKALSECRRVLKENGKCIFTVPIVVDRLSRNREGMKLSYHGMPNSEAEDQIVYTEFGVDVWKMVLKAGFKSCEFYTLEYPASLAIIASA